MKRLWTGARRFHTGLRAQSCNGRSSAIARRFSSAAAPSEASTELQQLQSEIEAEPLKCGEALKKWYTQGNSLAQQQVLEMFESLTYKDERGALKLMQFVMEEQPSLELSTHAYLRYMRLGARFYDAPTAERIYKKIPASRITEDLTAGYLKIMLKKLGSFKAEKLVRTLPEPKTSALWEAIICTYSERDMHEKMAESFMKLKKSGIEPTLLTLVHMLKLHSRLAGEPGLDEEAREAAERVDLETEKDQYILIPAMEIYSMLGDGEKVKKLWEVIKSGKVVLHDSLSSAIRCLGRVGEIEKAEEALQEALQGKSVRANPYTKMADAYAGLGMVDKAEELLREKINDTFFFNSLIVHYLRDQETVDKGVKMAKKQVHKGRMVSYEALVSLLPVLESRKDWDFAKKLVRRYLLDHHGDTKVLNAVLKVYVASEKKLDQTIVQQFEMVEPDEETMVLLASLPLKEPNPDDDV